MNQALKSILARRAARPRGLKWDLTPRALERWNPGIQAADTTAPATIQIFDVIGQDFWDDGVSPQSISAALQSIGANTPVVVHLNSPGGDLFDGLMIYSLLAEHHGDVTVKILGLAASVASVIAMAADRIEISRAGFVMIHNTWSVAVGDRHDHREFADYLEPFDHAMADIYAARTGLDTGELGEMMDRETWLGGQSAVDRHFADALLSAAAVGAADVETEVGDSRVAARKIDIALAKAGVARRERRRLMHDYKSSTPRAAGGGMPGATATNTPRAVVQGAQPLPQVSFIPPL